MGFSNSGGKVKLDQFKGNVRIYGNLDVGGEINKGLVNQVQAATAAIGQLETTGFLGDTRARGTFYQQLGQNWVGPIANPSILGLGAGWLGVTYGNTVLASVGTEGQLARSIDNGATWGALINNPFTAGPLDIFCVAYGNGVFVIGGNAAGVARSTDGGLTWGAFILGTGGFINSVAYGNGVFVAVGAIPNIARSTDLGITWTVIANPFGASTIQGVAFGNGVFIAVGLGGKIARSTDLGLTWALVSNPFPAVDAIRKVTFGNGVFVACSGLGNIARSIDNGATWGALISNPFGVVQLVSISYNFGIFQIGSTVTTTARSYDNGVTWGGLITNPFGGAIYGITSTPINIVAVGTGGAGGQIATAGWNAALSKYIEQRYTPVFTGFGVVTAINLTYTIVGNRLEAIGQFVPGIPTAVEARMSLPNGIISDASLVPSIQLCGSYVIDSAAGAAGFPTILIESGVGYITFGFWTVAQSGLTKRLGNNIFTNGIKVSLQFEFSLSGYNT
jgi:photosystem II stability/assembly factor-like uncharacterized protein